MNRQICLVLVVGAAVIAGTIWLTYPSRRPAFIADPTKYKFMHCSRCGREFKFDLDQFAKGCSKCNDSDLIPTDQSIAVIGREPSPFFRTFAWLMVELVGVMAAILFVTRKRNVSEDADYVYMRCEKCRQKIRYRERQVGNTAHCPRCKRQFAYPEVDGE